MTENTAPAFHAPDNLPEPNPQTAPPVSLGHTWVAAATIPLDERTARRANKYQSYVTPEGERVRVHVLDVYCSGCRQAMEDVLEDDPRLKEPCAAKTREGKVHLIGGDQAHRAKRLKAPPLPAGAHLMPGARVRRHGIDAVLSGEA